MDQLRVWIEREFSEICEELFAFLRFKTISTDPAYLKEHPRCCEWLTDLFERMQFKTETIETSGLPLFYAENLDAGENAPTILIYGHYDVQPVDPLELWASDPFEPDVRQGEVYARGAIDDKGQILFAAMAARALFAVEGKLPVNLKFCIEGEEECGSKGLSEGLSSLKEKLQADYLLVVDCGLPDAGTPAIDLGGRGIVTMEIALKGSNEDLHSGSFGGVAYNPNRALAELIAECWDADGRVAVPHFYDGVEELSEEEKKLYEVAYGKGHAKEAGIAAFSGEKGRSLVESNWLRPTLEINGLSGGYTGAGFKTVIPAKAVAKISCRLVPNQDPKKVARHVADFLKAKVKKGIELEVKIGQAARAFRGRADSRLAKAVGAAYEELFKKPCQKILSGGSIPVVADLQDAIGAQVVGMGYGLAGDQMHAPNEHFGLDRFKKGILTVARALQLMGEGR